MLWGKYWKFTDPIRPRPVVAGCSPDLREEEVDHIFGVGDNIQRCTRGRSKWVPTSSHSLSVQCTYRRAELSI
jgi:hypothetical protein